MKKIILSSDMLKAALKKLGVAVNQNTVLPIMKNILCKVGNNQMELITSDLEINISYKLVCECPFDPFEILLPFDFLSKIIAVIKNEPITIEVAGTKKAKLVSSDDIYEINSLEKVEDYPVLQKIPSKNVLQLDQKFLEVLPLAMLTVSSDDLRPAMTRAVLDIKKDFSYLASTDAHFLFRYKFSFSNNEPQQLQFSAKMATAIDGVEAAELTWSKDVIAIKSERITVWGKRHEDKYPDYNSVIASYGPTLELSKNDFVMALQKAGISNISTKQTTLLLQKEKNMLVLETNDPDFARNIFSKVPAVYTGEIAAIALNFKKMLTIMKQIEAITIRLHIHEASKAILISTEENPDYLGLLMPLLINN